MAARLASFGTRMTVHSFTPSRIGIMTSRLSKSAPEVGRTNFCGVSLGYSGYLGRSGGGAGAAPQAAVVDGVCAHEALTGNNTASASKAPRHGICFSGCTGCPPDALLVPRV